MNAFKILTCCLLFWLLFVPTVVMAENDYGAAAAAGQAGLTNTKISQMGDPATVIGEVINGVLAFVGIIFFVLVLYAGFSWMTAMGNTEQVTKAKGIIEAAVIGLVLVAGAYAIAKFVINRLGGSPGITNNTPVDCMTVADNTSCGDNQVCYHRQCVTECAAKYFINGSCGPRSACNTSAGFGIELNLCPGGTDNVCCYPLSSASN